MKLKCEIEIPENYTYKEKLDAMARASRDTSLWVEVKSLEELKKRTNLDNKCGSCKYYCPFTHNGRELTNGHCNAGRVWGQRTRPKCKLYERKK